MKRAEPDRIREEYRSDPLTALLWGLGFLIVTGLFLLAVIAVTKP